MAKFVPNPHKLRREDTTTALVVQETTRGWTLPSLPDLSEPKARVEQKLVQYPVVPMIMGALLILGFTLFIYLFIFRRGRK